MSNEVYALCEAKCLHETLEKNEMADYITDVLNQLSVKSIYVGTDAPSGGSSGDIYIQIL